MPPSSTQVAGDCFNPSIQVFCQRGRRGGGSGYSAVILVRTLIPWNSSLNSKYDPPPRNNWINICCPWNCYRRLRFWAGILLAYFTIINHLIYHFLSFFIQFLNIPICIVHLFFTLVIQDIVNLPYSILSAYILFIFYQIYSLIIHPFSHDIQSC